MKKWYLSKTMWVNIIATLGIIAQGIAGHEVISVEAQGLILTAINMILRLITNAGLTT